MFYALLAKHATLQRIGLRSLWWVELESRIRAPRTRENTINTPKKTAGLPLQKSNLRWKWMAGATAATAAGVTSSQADTVTVPLFNNYITATFLPSQGFHLNADLTGDNHPDVTMKSFLSTQFTHRTPFDSRATSFAQVAINGIVARGYLFKNLSVFGSPLIQKWRWVYSAKVGALGNATHETGSCGPYCTRPTPPGAVSVTSTIPISFTDNSINGGVLTHGLLVRDCDRWGGACEG